MVTISAAQAQQFFVQANGGVRLVKLRQTSYEGKLDPDASPYAYSFNMGISGLDAEGGFSFSMQRVSETMDGYFRTSYQGIVPVELKVHYGERLLTYEAFANGKLRFGKRCRVIYGLLGGIAKTTGPKAPYFEYEESSKPNSPSVFSRNYSQGRGWVWGAHAAIFYAVERRVGFLLSADYKDVRFNIKADSRNYKYDEAYSLSIIPISIGMRITF